MQKLTFNWYHTATRICFTVAFITGIPIILASARINQVSLGYKLAKLEAKREALASQEKILRLELNVLKQPNRIYHLSKKKFHFELPKARQAFQLGDS